MVKNVLIVLLAAACLFFGVDRYGSFLQKDEEISAGEYGGLLSLRELYSAGDYEEKVLPLLREAFVDGKVTRERMQKLDEKLNDLGLRVFERLTRQDKMEEFMFLGLRMTKGISEIDFVSAFGVKLESVYGKVISQLIANGLLKREGTRLALTEWGMDVSNFVLSEFLLGD